MKKVLFFLFILVGLSFTTSSFVSAEELDNFYGLNINPFIIESDVAKGGTTNSSVTVTNWTKEILDIETLAKDFVPNYETGQPIFVPDSEVNDKTYSLAQWIKIEGSPKFKLQPGESKEVKFTLNPPTDAEQGSHFGALLFSYKPPVKKGGIGQITQRVGTVILVNYGVGRETGNASLQSEKKVLMFGDSVELTSRFSNNGNVHLRPKGEIHIKNIFGKVVSSLPVNRDAEVLLPGVEKSFSDKWYPTGLSFGRYVAEANLVYGKNRLESHQTQVIWVFPVYLLFSMFLVIGGLAWFAFRGIHIYNRWIISQMDKKE